MNPVLAAALAFIAPAANALKSQINGEVAAELPKLEDEAATVLETVVAPKLDVPPAIIALAKGEVPAIEAAANPWLESELDLLLARLPAL